MQFELRVVVAGTTAPLSTGTVSSFNGRTGAVTPASGDYTAATGVIPTSTQIAGKNAIINGDFGVWQRGTSFSLSGSSVYTADRFTGLSPFGDTVTASQQTFTPGTAPVVGYEGTYFLRNTRSSGTGGFFMTQRIENVKTFANQTITVSFWAQASVSFTPANLYVQQVFGTGGSANVTATSSASLQPITTSWARYSYTIVVPSIAGKTIGSNNYFEFILQFNPGTASCTVDTWGWQIEAGSTATQFTTATGTIQGELAACQRYYWQTINGGAYAYYGTGGANSTTNCHIQATFPVPMRIVPTSLNYASLALYTFTDVSYTVSALAISASVGSIYSVRVDATSSGLTSGTPYVLANAGSTSGYLGFSAEL
jgi:hypothetical protein